MDDGNVAALAERQLGLVTRAQAVAAGLSAADLRKRIQSGSWTRVLPGVYALDREWSWEQQLLAACLWAGDGAIVSHRAAARLHGIDVAQKWAAIELTVPVNRRPEHDGTSVHRSIDPTPTERIGPFICTTIERTLIDLAAVLSWEELAIAVDSAWRREHDLLFRLECVMNDLGTRGRRGCRNLRRIVRDYKRRRRATASPLEARAWCCMRAAGLPWLDVAVPLDDDEGEMYADFGSLERKVAVEVDGYSIHGNREAFVEDARRAMRIAALGMTLVRLTHADLVPEQRARAMERLRRVLDVCPRRRARPWIRDLQPIPAAAQQAVAAA